MAKQQRFSCPKCGSSVTRRCELAYQQAVSTVYGSRYSSVRVTAVADRVSPPTMPQQRPWHPVDFFFIAVACFSGYVAGYALLVMERPGFALFPGAVAGVAIWWLSLYGRSTFDPDQHKADVEEYEREMQLYVKLWFCYDCGHVFQPAATKDVPLPRRPSSTQLGTAEAFRERAERLPVEIEPR